VEETYGNGRRDPLKDGESFILMISFRKNHHSTLRNQYKTPMKVDNTHKSKLSRISLILIYSKVTCSSEGVVIYSHP